VSLQGRIALVTGGGRGIGRAIALRLAEAGADVAVAARTIAQVNEVAEAVRQRGRRSLAITCDVRKRPQVEAMVQRVCGELGEPLVLVNNAGIAMSAKLSETTDEMWEEAIGTNATGSFYCTRAVLPLMLKAGWGRVVMIASVVSRVGAAYISAYAASKHAVLGLTRSVAQEVAGRGITVNAVCPGYVDTELTGNSVRNITSRTGRSADEARRILEGFSPQKRLMTADEVAGLALYLCGEEARGVNGQAIVLDGGAVQA
jgi:NAD(P)-dependent dehydrogenase (short-subunit alcohol dehydrogenase family)